MLSAQQVSELAPKLSSQWRVVEQQGRQHHLLREYRFKDFASALDFVNKVHAEHEHIGAMRCACRGWGVLHTHQ